MYEKEDNSEERMTCTGFSEREIVEDGCNKAQRVTYQNSVIHIHRKDGVVRPCRGRSADSVCSNNDGRHTWKTGCIKSKDKYY